MHKPLTIEKHLRKAAEHGSSGFSIVEAMVAAFIFFTAVMISQSLFNFSTKNTGQVELSQNEQNAVESDAAEIQRINEQFSCTSASSSDCNANLGSGNYPDEESYIPDGYNSTPATATWLQSNCSNGLGDELANYINTLPNSTLTNLGIIRTAFNVNTSGTTTESKHLYKVTWTKGSGLTIKSLTLYPTLAAWCP